MLKSLQWRLVGIFIMITIFLIIPIGLYLNNQIQEIHYKDFKDTIERVISDNTSSEEKLSDFMAAAIYNFGIDNFKSLTVYNNSVFEFVDSTDSLWNESSELLKNEILQSSNFLDVMTGLVKVGEDARLLRIGSKSYFDYAKAVELSDGGFILYFRYDSEGWRKITEKFSNILLTSIIIAIIVSLVLGYMLSKTITLPIIRITDKAKSIAGGNFDKPLDVKSEDEIGQLTRTFNHMARNLKETLIEVSSEKSKIETILNYMTDGVIAFNLKGDVIHANPAAKKMLGIDEIDLGFNEFAKMYNTDITLEEITYLEILSTKEADVPVGSRFLKMYFAVFTDENKKREGIIAVLQDITEQQKLDLMRREFVANVSHELRTPLTSVKSYSEALLDGALENREISERFLEVINAEADRMTRLVRDLLQLSRLDNHQMKWNMKQMSFLELVKKCTERLKIEADVKKQSLKSYAIGEIPGIVGDRDRLEQVILNIISNAIKYTPEDGEITIYTGKSYNEVYVKVKDNGIGIPEEDLPRIYERFYRVDKARSRELGGTGLGLSIAQEIVEAHQGNISINSQVDRGTEVIVRIPVNQVL